MANPTNNAVLGLNNRIRGNIVDDLRNEDDGCQHGGNMNFRNFNPLSPVEEGLHPLHYLQQPDSTIAHSCIRIPLRTGTLYFLNGMIPLLPNFHGMENEKSYLYIREFEEVCSIFLYQSYQRDIIRLKLFPFTLKDKMKA